MCMFFIYPDPSRRIYRLPQLEFMYTVVTEVSLPLYNLDQIVKP